MKRQLIIFSMVTLLVSLLGAQEKLPLNTTASLSLKAHSTIGIDLNDYSSGMETSIDQIQIWFELFPTENRGPESDPENEEPQVNFQINGSKWYLKWFDKAETPGASTGASNAEAKSEFESIVAEIVWGKFFWGITGFANPNSPTYGWGTPQSKYQLLGINRASLTSLFERTIPNDKSHSHISLGLPMLPSAVLNRNLASFAENAYTLTGMNKVGYRSNELTVALSFGSGAKWDENNNQAWAFGLDLNTKPVENLEINLESSLGLNFEIDDPADPGTKTIPNNPLAAGADLSYVFAISKDIGVVPLLGFDFNKASLTGSEMPRYELGATIRTYWHGPKDEAIHDFIDIWTQAFATGLSISANMNQDRVINLQASLYEAANELSIIPNLGAILMVEAANLGTFEGDRGLAVFAETEYKIDRSIRPYIWGKYVQGFGSGALAKYRSQTETMAFSAGVLLNPIKHLSFDLNYRNDSTIGIAGVPDKGQVTLTARLSN